VIGIGAWVLVENQPAPAPPSAQVGGNGVANTGNLGARDIRIEGGGRPATPGN
jgi:hypothetical protein